MKNLKNNIMNFNTYQELIKTTRLPTADYSYVVLGTVGELGEFYGKLAKGMRDKTMPERDDLLKELGDILWFIGAFCEDLGSSLEEVAHINAQKLLSRKERGTLQGSGDER